MDDLEYEFILQDRIAKIQAINEQYDLINNSYISFSGGKDSTILHYLVDLALPNNNIPRVFINTGIEFNKIVSFVKSLASNDSRFIIKNQFRNIPRTLNTYGYPFKSKEHSEHVLSFNRNPNAPYIVRYINGVDIFGNPTDFKCPKILLYQFSGERKYNYSDLCCFYLKKSIAHDFEVDSGLFINISGIRSSEGGRRRNANCVNLFNGSLKSFHPLLICDDDFINYFVYKFNIKLCDLYYPPFNFKRTGCKGCPFNLNLQNDLLVLKKLLPNEYKQCLHLWKPVYDEYVRIGYRLDKDFYDIKPQYSIFDY